MQRRVLGITIFFVLGIVKVPFIAEAQQAGKVFRIAELNAIPPPPPSEESHQAFRRTLHELGFVEGTNLRMEDRFAAWRNDRLREYAAELVRLKVDVIFAVSSLA